MIELEAGC